MASQFRRISEFKFLKLSPPQILVLGFASIILIGALLLTLPISSTSGNSRNLLMHYLLQRRQPVLQGLLCWIPELRSRFLGKP